MIQIATTREQSGRLLTAGVPRESADMTWVAMELPRNGKIETEWDLVCGKMRGISAMKWIPAWSTSVLWSIIYNLDKTYEFPTNLSAEELIETLVTTICYRYELR